MIKGKNSKKKDDVVNLHCFVLPFFIESRYSKQIEEIWKRKYKKETGNCDREFYMLQQYLSNPARELFGFSGGESQFFSKYVWDNVNLDYVIHTTKDEKDKLIPKKYSLQIECIEIHYYRKVQIGLLFMRCRNTKYHSVKDIKIINDLGRRISLPFIPNSDDGFSLCADSIEFVDKNGNNHGFITDFKSMIAEYYNNPNNIQLMKKLGKPGEMWEKLILPEEAAQLSKYISWHADDRMFLISLIRSDELSEDVKKCSELGFDEEKVRDSMKRLYSVIFVDKDSPSCNNKAMMKKLLEKACYMRWADFGTLYATTEYSQLCIVDEQSDIEDSVVRPFIFEYSYIVSLVLSQRIILQEIAKSIGAVSKNAFRGIKVQGRLLSAESSYFIPEISCQEQGIELYHLLQEQLLISEEYERIGEMAEHLSARNINGWSLAFGVSGIIIALLEVIGYFF